MPTQNDPCLVQYCPLCLGTTMCIAHIRVRPGDLHTVLIFSSLLEKMPCTRQVQGPHLYGTTTFYSSPIWDGISKFDNTKKGGQGKYCLTDLRSHRKIFSTCEGLSSSSSMQVQFFILCPIILINYKKLCYLFNKKYVKHFINTLKTKSNLQIGAKKIQRTIHESTLFLFFKNDMTFHDRLQL